jgi:hypothetical protein
LKETGVRQRRPKWDPKKLSTIAGRTENYCDSDGHEKHENADEILFKLNTIQITI